MKAIIVTIGLLFAASYNPTLAAEYSPSPKIGDFLRQFEKAYRVGDQEWIQSAVDEGGVLEEAKAVFFSFLGPKKEGETISNLTVVAAQDGYDLPNSLIDTEIAPTIPVDFIITFTRMLGEVKTTIKVPAGYRNGKIWLVGIKKK
jgi:hypothetical protein